MRVVIAGDRNFGDYKVLDEAIRKSGFKVTEVVSGGARGADKLGEHWAKTRNIPIKLFRAKWNDLTQSGAKIKARKNPWTGRMEQYNSSAGFQRNEKMAEYADALIAIQPNGPTSGTQHMIDCAKKHDLKIYEYEKPAEQYDYVF